MKVTKAHLRKCNYFFLPGVLFITISVILGLRFGRPSTTNNDNPSGLPETTVDLGYAQYVGNTLPGGTRQYLGVRYALPPTGDRRWRAPEEPLPNQGRQQAKAYGAICYPIGLAYPADGHDEDCLFANIWAPNVGNLSAKLPVWVFIQGGGYSTLASWNWNGTDAVEKSGGKFLFINFNYRVGLFGFLAGGDVEADGNLNVGLLDQRRLLQWVQTHISKFGAYGGRNDNLFVGAMAQSAFFPAQPHVSDLEYQFDRVLDEVGCRSAQDKMKCLRGTSMGTLQRANDISPFPGRIHAPHFYWTPCVDGDLLVDYPSVLFKTGNFVQVPVLFGVCKDEGSVFADEAESSADQTSYLLDQYPHLNATHQDTLASLYPRQPPLPNHAPYFPSLSRAYGEATFSCPSTSLLTAYGASSSPAWGYRFAVPDADNTAAGLGIPHVFDAPAVLGPGMLPTAASYYAYNAPVVPLVMAYFASFVRALDPNRHRTEGAPVWGTWGANGSRVVFEGEGRMKVENAADNGMGKRCAFWDEVAETTEQ
ncbi:Neuroligin-4 like protein [Verticillium longisporum]|uniref:Neuroligin-4 like protein n=1 Tax=Verticillium longisporum TaxID=100787 RepID=A0A8I2ZQT9_VERLO|nr:Peroxisomal enzyme type 2 [Verticillium dahliae VDG2]KAG7134974.1 Neuroligin-4 like protein [Verticillium longisporum]